MNGYAGKLLFVDLKEGTFEERRLTDEIARDFIGGYGIGAKILYGMMKPGADPLGPDNVLGFVTGPLTGTAALFSGRYTVVCKSPASGGWNDANSGGFFGPELKKAGFDGVFFKGASKKPVYLWINDGKAELRDASAMWGKDILETENAIKKELKDDKISIAGIGQAGEKLSLIAAIINDGHRAAGRGGSGAVMGSKKLKAVAVRGTGKIPVADPDYLKEINKQIVTALKEGPTKEVVGVFSSFGTTLFNEMSALSGDTAVKNWAGAGFADVGEQNAKKLEAGAMDTRYRVKKYACSNCPIGCGAVYNAKDGKWPVGETGRPEYETAGVFGALVLNSDPEVVIKCNHICNMFGLDTISAGGTVAWAIECYENGIFTKKDTGGIELKWGNGPAIVEATQVLADQSTDFGKLLALGSEAAAKKIRKGSEYLVTAKGIELPMHDPKFAPAFARTYQFDPTPGRHVKGGIGFEQQQSADPSKYIYTGTGEKDANETAHQEIINSVGLCMFSFMAVVEDAAGKLMKAVTGWDFGQKEQMVAGLRIFNMRHAFNLREGLKPSDFNIPKRAVGEPALKQGPLANITVDNNLLADNFFKAMQFDKTTGKPSRSSLEKLGSMEEVIKDLQL